VLLGWWWLHGSPPTPKGPPEPTIDGNAIILPIDAPQWGYLVLAVASETPALAPLPAPGVVHFDERRTASVGTPLPGRVERVQVRAGDRVKRGDRLFSVRSGALADLARELKAATSDFGTKKRIADRTRELVGLKAASEKDQLTAESDERDAQFALDAAVAKRQSLQAEIADDSLFWVTAPQDGTVVDLNVNASQEVTPEAEAPLLRIADLAEVIVLTDVQEHDAVDLAVGMPVTIQTPAGDVSLPGTIEHVGEVVDPKRRSVGVRVRAENADGALRPNAFVEVAREPDRTHQRVQVPAEAIVTDGDESVAFVVRDQGRLERVPVTVGRQRDGQLEVRSGLAPGDRYVAKGAILLLNAINLEH